MSRPTWQVDIGTVIETAQAFQAFHEGLSTDMRALTDAVEGLLAAHWSGDAADEFSRVFQAWLSEGGAIVDDMGVYASTLGLTPEGGIAGAYMRAHTAIGAR